MSFGQLGSYEFLKDMVDAAAFHLVESKTETNILLPRNNCHLTTFFNKFRKGI